MSVEDLYLERLAFDVPEALDERTELGPLGEMLVALREHVEDHELTDDQVVVRHIGGEKDKFNRVRWNLIKYNDLITNTALNNLSILAIQSALETDVPSLNETMSVYAAGLVLSDPTEQNHRFIEIELCESYSQKLRYEASRTKDSLSHLAGKKIFGRIPKALIRLAWIKGSAPENTAKEMFEIVDSSFEHPMAILLKPVLPLIKGGVMEEADRPEVEIPKHGEVEIPEIVTVQGEDWQEALELIRIFLRHAQAGEEEARARGDFAAQHIELEVASRFRTKAEAMIELLGILHEPPKGALNWHEVIDNL